MIKMLKRKFYVLRSLLFLFLFFFWFVRPLYSHLHEKILYNLNIVFPIDPHSNVCRFASYFIVNNVILKLFNIKQSTWIHNIRCNLIKITYALRSISTNKLNANNFTHIYNEKIWKNTSGTRKKKFKVETELNGTERNDPKWKQNRKRGKNKYVHIMN